MDRQIKPSQYMSLITSFMLGSILLLSFIFEKSLHDTWAAFILGTIIFIPFLGLYIVLGKKFPGKNLIQIHDIVYGRIIGKIVSVIYIFYFISLLSFNLRDVGAFYTGYIMPETPIVVFILLFASCAAYAVKKGIHTVAKVSLIGAVLVFIVVALTFLLLLNKMDIKNFLPVLETPLYKMAQATATISMIPYGELVLFLMIIPMVDDLKKLGKYSIAGMGLAGIVFMVIILRNIAVLGASGQVYSQTSFQTVRMINIGDFINRIEIIVSMNNTILMFIKVSVIYYVTVKSIEQILNLKTYGPLIIPVGSIVIVYAMIAHTSEIAHLYWGETYGVFFEVPFVVILPFLTFIISKIRRLEHKEKDIPKREIDV